MGIYRILWRIVVGVLTVSGASLAFLYVPWGFLISISVCALILGPLIGAGIRSQTRGSAGPTLRSSIIAAVLAVVGVLAVSGLSALFDAAALLVAGLLAVSSPPVLRRILSRSPQRPRPGQQPNPPGWLYHRAPVPRPQPAQNRPRYPRRPDHGHRCATHSVTPSCAGGGAPASPPCSTPCPPASDCA